MARGSDIEDSVYPVIKNYINNKVLKNVVTYDYKKNYTISHNQVGLTIVDELLSEMLALFIENKVNLMTDNKTPVNTLYISNDICESIRIEFYVPVDEVLFDIIGDCFSEKLNIRVENVRLLF